MCTTCGLVLKCNTFYLEKKNQKHPHLNITVLHKNELYHIFTQVLKSVT